jgi:hypothetical protein
MKFRNYLGYFKIPNSSLEDLFERSSKLESGNPDFRNIMNMEDEDSQWSDSDSDEELIFMEHIYIHYYNAQRNRSYITRAGIMEPKLSPWNHLLAHSDALSFLSVTGVDRPTFHLLITILWGNLEDSPHSFILKIITSHNFDNYIFCNFLLLLYIFWY